MSRYCGFDGIYDWSFPENGLYQGPNLSRFWKKPNCYPFLIRIDDEIAGFALIDKNVSTKDADWSMGEFFIVRKFQGKGIGRKVAFQIFDQFPGTWEVGQMINNVPAINFWKAVINKYTNGKFFEGKKEMLKPKPHELILLKFATRP